MTWRIVSDMGRNLESDEAAYGEWFKYDIFNVRKNWILFFAENVLSFVQRSSNYYLKYSSVVIVIIIITLLRM